MIIGVTGPSGSGKSTFAKNLAELGGHRTLIIDIDKIGHSVMTYPQVRQSLEERFGCVLSRKELSKRVFSDKDAMRILKDVTWSFMQIEIDVQLGRTMEYDNFILDWVLLPGVEYWDRCNITYLCWADFQTRLARVNKRDWISKEELELRDTNAPNFAQFQYTYEVSYTRDKEICKK